MARVSFGVRWSASKIVIGLATLGAVLADGAGICVIGGRPDWIGIDPFAKRPFSADAWRSANADGRSEMCRALISLHLTVGMTRAEVVTLLGKPDESAGLGIDRPTGTLIYFIGNSWGYHGWDDTFLRIRLDANGRIEKADVFGY